MQPFLIVVPALALVAGCSKPIGPDTFLAAAIRDDLPVLQKHLDLAKRLT